MQRRPRVRLGAHGGICPARERLLVREPLRDLCSLGGRWDGARRDCDGHSERRRYEDPDAHPVKRGEENCAARELVKRRVVVSPDVSVTTARPLWMPTVRRLQRMESTNVPLLVGCVAVLRSLPLMENATEWISSPLTVTFRRLSETQSRTLCSVGELSSSSPASAGATGRASPAINTGRSTSGRRNTKDLTVRERDVDPRWRQPLRRATSPHDHSKAAAYCPRPPISSSDQGIAGTPLPVVAEPRSSMASTNRSGQPA